MNEVVVNRFEELDQSRRFKGDSNNFSEDENLLQSGIKFDGISLMSESVRSHDLSERVLLTPRTSASRKFTFNESPDDPRIQDSDDDETFIESSI